MKKLFILFACVLGACGNESDKNPWCIENVNALQVYDVVENSNGKYALAVTCNIRAADTKECIGGTVVMSAAQMSDIDKGHIIKADKDKCFHFPSTKPITINTDDGKIRYLGPLVEFTSKYSITTHKGYKHWYNEYYNECLQRYTQDTKFNTKQLCTCITNDITDKTLDMYINNQNFLDDMDFYSKTVEKCRALPENTLNSIKRNVFKRTLTLDENRESIKSLSDNNENPSCENDIYSVLVVTPVYDGTDAWMGVVCRSKDADRGFCLGETVIILNNVFGNLQKGQRISPTKDHCFIYVDDTDTYITVNGKKQSVKVLSEGTKYSVFTEKGYQYRYNEIYNKCIKDAKEQPESQKEKDELLCDCFAKYVVDSSRDVASIDNKIMRYLAQKLISWRFKSGFYNRCGPGTEVYEKVQQFRGQAGKK